MVNNYTIQLCDIIEEIWNEGHPDETHSIYQMNGISNVLAKIEEKIDYARPVIFQFPYPYYGDLTDKTKLERHILKSYYTRNINVDSVARWLLFLEERLDDIMPKYVAIHDAQVKLIASDILNPYHIDESKSANTQTSKDRINNISSTSNSSSTADTESSSSGSDNTKIDATNKFSNTPQALAQSGTDYLTNMTVDNTDNTNEYSNVGSNKNISNASASDSTATTEASSENKAEDYLKIIKGNISKNNNAELIKQYEDVILNIEQMITNELKDLFYLIY